MSRLQISVLGLPEIRWEGVPLLLSKPRIRALLYRLSVQDEPVPREHIGFLFWPRKPESSARRYVTQICGQLRRALPERDAVILDDKVVGLNPSLVWSDLIHFHRLAEEYRRRPSIILLWALADLHRGPLLSGFSLPDYPEYEAWFKAARRLCMRDNLAALQALLDQLIDEGDYVGAIEVAQRYLDVDPADEAMHRCLIGLYGVVHDRMAAKGQYGTCVEVLRREQGRSPQPATTTAYESAMDGTIRSHDIDLARLRRPLFASRDMWQRQWQYEPKPRRQKLVLF